MMEVEAESGKVIQKWEPEASDAPLDKMSNALKKIDEGKKRRQTLFDAKKSEIEGHRKESEDLFRKEMEKIKREGVKENPLKPFDLD
jgi:hypothetical protein